MLGAGRIISGQIAWVKKYLHSLKKEASASFLISTTIYPSQ